MTVSGLCRITEGLQAFCAPDFKNTRLPSPAFFLQDEFSPRIQPAVTVILLLSHFIFQQFQEHRMPVALNMSSCTHITKSMSAKRVNLFLLFICHSPFTVPVIVNNTQHTTAIHSYASKRLSQGRSRHFVYCTCVG
jgi:hypothetical protein